MFASLLRGANIEGASIRMEQGVSNRRRVPSLVEGAKAHAAEVEDKEACMRPLSDMGAWGNRLPDSMLSARSSREKSNQRCHSGRGVPLRGSLSFAGALRPQEGTDEGAGGFRFICVVVTVSDDVYSESR